jgi:hypothetical protein
MKQTIKRFLAFTAALFVFASAYAQITTSSMSGIIKGSDGEPLTGAAVVAVHTPSGTQYYAIANAEGFYAIQGMRPGGPYEVTISFVGCKTNVYSNVTLPLGETYSQNSILENSESLEEVYVIADAKSKFSQEKTGAATNIDNSQIQELPTVSRSITDVTRLSPYGGNGMSFAGADGRTANFTVDGANFNNNFGLSSALPGGGNPISIDAIEELQVVISPFDVRQTNFIGGGVNAITKSGTNTFRGSAYVYHRNENMRGDTIDGEQISGARATDRATTYGVTLGGPIVKNKLFFFVNAEYAKVPTIANRWRGSDNGVANANNYISRCKNSDLKDVSGYVASKYHYDTGSWTDFPADESNIKVLARLDWNISNKHHLALRYNYTLNNAWNAPNASSMDGGTRTSGGRTSQYSMSFANSMYSMQNVVHSFSLDLNSRLSDNLSNQFLATFSKLDDVRGTNSKEFPMIDILDGAGQMYMALGYELFTWNNAVHNTIANIKDDITYYAGSHKITAGINAEYQMADNQYMRNGSGYYRYKTLDDFMNGATPEVVCLTYGYDGEQYPAARVQFYKAGIYGQDEWSVNEKFKLTYGLRVDGLFFNNADLMTNAAIYDLKYYPASHNYQETHIDTGKWPSANITLSPRVGFSWDVLGDKSLKVRGGSGLFSGRLPLVFFTNMPTNGGMVQYQAQLNASNGKKLGYSMDEFKGGLVTDSEGYATIDALLNKLTSMRNAQGQQIFPTTIKPEDGTVPSSICGVDPKFKMPQVWKSSIAVDYAFNTSFPFSVTAEGIFNKTINGVCISDWSVKNVGGFARFNGVDNRPIYPTGFRTTTKAFVLENTNKGYGWSANFTMNMTPIEGLHFMAAYTHTVSKEVTGMPGSAAESAFTYVPTTEGPNYIKLHNSQYVTPDRVVASLSHNDKSGNHYSLIYESWRGGYNYSYMTTNDMNGDGYNYDAIYVPTDEEVNSNQYRFVSTDDKNRFMDYVHASKYLSSIQGQVAEGYSLYSPWVHRIDISYKHDFKVKCGNNTNTLQLGFDLKNVLNLFNSSWGVSKYLNPAIGSEARILKYEGVDADGYATFSTPSSISGTTQTFVPNHAIGQCWYASVGIKYMFN